MVPGISKKLKLVITVQIIALCLAITNQLEASFNPSSNSPNFLILLLGLIIGGLLSWLASWLLQGQYNNLSLSLRLIAPFWLCMGFISLFMGGIFWLLDNTRSMDWRPVLSAILLGTLPGNLLGWLVSWYISKGIIANEPLGIYSNTLKIITAEEKTLQTDYPGSRITVQRLGYDSYACILKVPRFNQVVTFYVVCREGYPSIPPSNVNIELILPGNRKQEVPYSVQHLYRWKDTNGLRDIVREAIDILRL